MALSTLSHRWSVGQVGDHPGRRHEDVATEQIGAEQFLAAGGGGAAAGEAWARGPAWEAGATPRRIGEWGWRGGGGGRGGGSTRLSSSYGQEPGLPHARRGATCAPARGPAALVASRGPAWIRWPLRRRSGEGGGEEASGRSPQEGAEGCAISGGRKNGRGWKMA